MGRKPREPREKTDRKWREAAEAAGVSVGELSAWLRERPHLYHHTQWSQWATGTGIPDRLIVLFLRAKLDRFLAAAVPDAIADNAPTAQVKGEQDARSHLQPPPRPAPQARLFKKPGGGRGGRGKRKTAG